MNTDPCSKRVHLKIIILTTQIKSHLNIASLPTGTACRKQVKLNLWICFKIDYSVLVKHRAKKYYAVNVVQTSFCLHKESTGRVETYKVCASKSYISCSICCMSHKTSTFPVLYRTPLTHPVTTVQLYLALGAEWVTWHCVFPWLGLCSGTKAVGSCVAPLLLSLAQSLPMCCGLVALSPRYVLGIAGSPEG